MYLLRLDDASEYMNLINWKRMEIILLKYNIKPLFGIIPSNEDPELIGYGKIDTFWEWMNSWQKRGWIPALHGYKHAFETKEGGINPVNDRSEFAGVNLENQRKKIREGCQILSRNGINPNIFFAPAHTFDKNTLSALRTESSIRIISDTVANDVYYQDGFYFIPQQAGYCRKLPFKVVTFCYHPNVMENRDFRKLEKFLEKYNTKFGDIKGLAYVKRKKSVGDKILSELYFVRRK